MFTDLRDCVTLRVLASPQDTALDGKTISAGSILEWIDRAGYACAVGWARGYCVTAYVGNVRFTRTIHAGQLVELTARIIQTGRSSMQVWVTVSSADVATGRFESAIDCLLVFVAVGDDRKPRPILQWEPHDELGRTLQHSANERLTTRRAIRDAMMAESYSEQGSTPRTQLRFLAAPGDANWGGNAHGGTVMRWIHEAAWCTAASWSSTSAVATYSGGIHFLRPIGIGHVVEIDSRIIHTDERTMHVATRVSSAPAAAPKRLELTTVCMSVLVDAAEDGTPCPVRPLVLHSAEDRRLDEHARELIRMRAAIAPLPHLSTL